MPREYYFISDKHIGGHGHLQSRDFETELPGGDTRRRMP